MISDKRTSGLLGQLGNIKNDEEFEKYIFFVAYFLSPISTFSIFYNIIMVLDINLLNLRIRDSYLMTAILVYNVKDYYVHLETVS